jgi:hypothetical protein
MTKTKMTHDELIASVMADYTAKMIAEGKRRQAILEAHANGTYQAPEGQFGTWHISDRH